MIIFGSLVKWNKKKINQRNVIKHKMLTYTECIYFFRALLVMSHSVSAVVSRASLSRYLNNPKTTFDRVSGVELK